MAETVPPTWSSAIGRLVIDLDAVRQNYRTLSAKMGDITCGGCVKADSYGLGMLKVAPELWNAGCREFFVSFLEGGVKLRAVLPDARIHVFTGISGGTPADFHHHNLIPVLNSLANIQTWRQYCNEIDQALAADIHVDTGMLRLGLPADEIKSISDDPSLIAGLNVDTVMSHLACGDEVDSPKNAEQLALFSEIRKVLPMGRASLANTCGIYLSPDFHFDMARPGAGLYGISPTPAIASDMMQVVRLQGKILQTRHVEGPRTVGYGAHYKIKKPTTIATVGIGYADGYLRSFNNNAIVRIGTYSVPVVGSVSMDMITLDITDVPEHLTQPGMAVDLVTPEHGLNDLAREAGTISYELLTALGGRYHRVYTGGSGGETHA